METYTTNSFCKNVLKIQTPFPMLKITFLYKFLLLLSVYFYCTRYIEYVYTQLQVRAYL